MTSAGVARIGVDAGADGGAAHVDLEEQPRGLAQARDVLAVVTAKASNSWPRVIGHGVLELGAAHLEDVVELHALGVRGRPAARPERRAQGAQLDDDGEAHGGGVDVVGGLRQVHVVVRVAERVLAAGAAQQLQGAVGDHLVGVHVGRGAGAALHHVDDEVAVPVAVDDLLAGAVDGIGDVGRRAGRACGWRGRPPA